MTSRFSSTIGVLVVLVIFSNGCAKDRAINSASVLDAGVSDEEAGDALADSSSPGDVETADQTPNEDTPEDDDPPPLVEGRDGRVSLGDGLSHNLNTDVLSPGRRFADGIAYRVVPPALGGVTVARFRDADVLSDGIAAGDDLLLINLQGSSDDFEDVGNYEVVTVSSVTEETIVLTEAVTKSFGGLVGGDQRVVVQRIPQYTDLEIFGDTTLTTSPFDGLETPPEGVGGDATGVVALQVLRSLTVESGSSIEGSALGYRGGLGGETGSRGESYDPADNTFAGLGSDDDVALCNSGRSGSAGEHAYGDGPLERLFFGPGGGGGSHGSVDDVSMNNGGHGGRGGGIIFILAQSVVVSGLIHADGNPGGATTRETCETIPDKEVSGGAGGGGAGGSVLLSGYILELGTDRISAAGRAGPGPVGGEGRLAIRYTSSLQGSTSTPLPHTSFIPLPDGGFSILGLTGGDDSTIDEVLDHTEPTLHWQPMAHALSFRVTIRDAEDTRNVCEPITSPPGISHTLTGCSLETGSYRVVLTGLRSSGVPVAATNNLYEFSVP